MSGALHDVILAVVGGAQAAVATALVLVLPGLLLFAGVAGRRGQRLEWIVSSLATSLAVTVLAGLVLNRLPDGLVPSAWWTALCTLCGLAAPVGLLPFREARTGPPPAPAAPGSRARLAVVALSIAIAAGAIWLARSGAEAHREYAYTNLWIVPEPGPGTATALVGIENKEQAEQVYALEIMANGALVGLVPDIRLGPGERVVRPIVAPRQLAGEDMIEARLFLAERPDLVYRRVWLRLAAARPSDVAARTVP
ncbi:hypothetical protein [uncultured Alsobacter sp.]|uniref:hypothetical protein n=1 Tax=uncultured Alsobacter sp. TaxID=1748258 RepID=UPI0025F72EDC|nr:hypothetical protein [uncultured Alsobacter sp.]